MAKMLLIHLFFFFFFLFILLSHYFIFSSGMLNNILCQMCGRMYFPIFLLSVGLFTLVYIEAKACQPKSFNSVLFQRILPNQLYNRMRSLIKLEIVTFSSI